MKYIAPSVLSADFANLARDIKTVEERGCRILHVDVMDGHFVPNISIGVPVVKSIRACTDMTLDVHLMITDPIDYIEPFAQAGADMITFHIESDSDPAAVTEKIIACGKKPSIAIKPATPVKTITDYLPQLYMALVMTVEPGFGGRSFMSDMLPKVRELRGLIDKNGYSTLIETDGGINLETARVCAQAGVDVMVAGSAIFGEADSAAAYTRLCSSVNGSGEGR